MWPLWVMPPRMRRLRMRQRRMRPQRMDLSRNIVSSGAPTRSILQPKSRLEHPGDDAEANGQETHGHGHAGADAHISIAIEAPAEAADQVHDGIEQTESAPGRRQHVDGVEGPSEECERSDDQHGNELQLLES